MNDLLQRFFDPNKLVKKIPRFLLTPFAQQIFHISGKTADDLHTKVTSGFAAGNLDYDLIWSYATTTAEWAEAGYLEDITDRITPELKEDLKVLLERGEAVPRDAALITGFSDLAPLLKRKETIVFTPFPKRIKGIENFDRIINVASRQMISFAGNLTLLESELKNYAEELYAKPRYLVLNKSDLLDEEELDFVTLEEKEPEDLTLKAEENRQEAEEHRKEPGERREEQDEPARTGRQAEGKGAE